MSTNPIIPEIYEMVWDDNDEDIDNEADMENELGTMLTNIMGNEDEFKEILRSNGIITMKIFFTFIRRPILQILSMLGESRYRIYRASIVKILTVNEEIKEGGSLCKVDMNTIHNVITKPEYISAYNTHKKTLRESLELAWRQHNLQTLQSEISRQALSEEERKVVATATPHHQGKTLQPRQVPEQQYASNNNVEPDPEEPLSKNFDAALYAQSVAMRNLTNPSGYKPTVITKEQRVLPRTGFSSKIRWNGQRETFASFQVAFEGQLYMSQCGYAISPSFVQAYVSKKESCLDDFPEIGIHLQQLKADSAYIFGAIMTSCNGAAITHRMLERHRTTQDGILAWHECVNTYMLGGTKKLQMAAHEQVIQTKYYPGYHNGIVGFVDDYRGAFNGLFGLQRIYTDAEMTNRLLNNLWTPELSTIIDTCTSKGFSFTETCNHIQDHGIRVAAFEAMNSASMAQTVVSSDRHTFDTTSDMTVRQLLNTMVQRRQNRTHNQYPDDLMIPRTIWRQLTPSASSEIQHIRDTIMSPSTNSIPPSGSSITNDTTTSMLSNPPLVPKQYSNPAERNPEERAANMSMQSTHQIETQQNQDTSDDPDAEQLISLLTEVLKHEEKLNDGIRSIYTVHT